MKPQERNLTPSAKAISYNPQDLGNGWRKSRWTTKGRGHLFLGVNGYSPQAWDDRGATSEADLLRDLGEKLTSLGSIRCVAYGAEFDKSHIQNAYERHGQVPPEAVAGPWYDLLASVRQHCPTPKEEGGNTLTNAYRIATGRRLTDAQTAGSDAEAAGAVAHYLLVQQRVGLEAIAADATGGPPSARPRADRDDGYHQLSAVDVVLMNSMLDLPDANALAADPNNADQVA